MERSLLVYATGRGRVQQGTVGLAAADTPEARQRESTRLREVAQEFEAIFIAQMLKTMRGRLGQAGFLPMSHAERTMREMLDEEMGRAIASAGGIGLAGLLVAALEGR